MQLLGEGHELVIGSAAEGDLIVGQAAFKTWIVPEQSQHAGEEGHEQLAVPSGGSSGDDPRRLMCSSVVRVAA